MLTTVVAGTGISVVDASAATVALPTIAAWYGADLPTVQWIMTGNLLAVAALLVPMGRLGDLVGRKRLFVVGFALFAAASVAAALSPGIGVLISARIMAGIGASMAQANGIPIALNHYGEDRRGYVLGIQMGVVGLGGITGPALGGFITSFINWQSIFWVTAAGTLLVCLAAQLVFRATGQRDPQAARRFDWWGALLSAGFLVALLAALTSGPRVGWSHPGFWTGLILAACLLVAFIVWEKRCRHPMLELSMFASPLFSLGVLASVAHFMSMSSVRFLVPFHLTAVEKLSPAQVGLALVPAAVVIATVGPFAGRLSDFWGARRVANLGMIVTAGGLMVLLGLNPDAGTGPVIGALMLMALGGAVFHAPNSSSIMGALDQQRMGVAAGFISLSRNAGNVIGVALTAALVSATMARRGLPPVLDPAASDTPTLEAFDQGAQVVITVLLVILLTVLLSILWTLSRKSAPTGSAR